MALLLVPVVAKISKLDKTVLPLSTTLKTLGDFPLQADRALRCPAGNILVAHERHREADGSLRVIYAASIRDSRPCPLPEQCQWSRSATAKSRQVSVLLHPLAMGSAPMQLRETGTDDTNDTPACVCITSKGRVQVEPALPRTSASSSPLISRAEQAHSRLSWAERLARNARTDQTDRNTLTFFGLPERVATFLGLPATSMLLQKSRVKSKRKGL